MEKEKYNIIARLYKFITNRHYNGYCQFGGFNGSYKVYFKKDTHFNKETLELIDELKSLKTLDFYKLDYLKNHGYPNKYYEEELVKESDLYYGFHYQLPTILFYYLFNRLKESAEFFLKEIESTNFKSNYGHFVKRDEYRFEYPNIMHQVIFKYLDTRIEDFYLLHHLMNWLSEMGYADTSMTVYKIKMLENQFKSLEGFDFENVDLD